MKDLCLKRGEPLGLSMLVLMEAKATLLEDMVD